MAFDANATRANQPGFDLIARRDDGRELRVSVKSVSVNGARHDYGVGRSFERHSADVYAFVDMTSVDRPVYLVGARTAVLLAMERHRHYQIDRGREAEALNSWAPKISRRLLEEMACRNEWSILEAPTPAEWPAVTTAMLARARADAPKPRGADVSKRD